MADSTTWRSGSTPARKCCARPTSSSSTACTSRPPRPSTRIAQGFFLYGYEPGGNRIEVTTGGYLVYDPEQPTVVWNEDERKLGQAWRVKTVDTFHTYGTPPVE